MGDFADYVRLLAGPRASTVETGGAFLRAATETVLASYEPPAEEVAAAVQAGGRDELGLDALYVGESEVVLAQVKAGAASAGQQCADVERLLRLPRELLAGAGAWAARASVREALERGLALRLIYLAAAPLAESNRAWLPDPPLPERLAQFPGAEVRLEIIDGDGLESRFAAMLDGTAGRPCDVVWDLGPAYWHLGPPRPHASIELTLPALTLTSAYASHGERLFRFNPRSDLGENRVNRAIGSTLRGEPGVFHLLNNGVTAVCRGFALEGAEGPGTGRLRIGDLQVVNGCQTTRSLWKAASRDAASLVESYVQLRLIAIREIDLPRSGGGLRGRISASTNLQTALICTDDLWARPEQERHAWRSRRCGRPGSTRRSAALGTCSAGRDGPASSGGRLGGGHGGSGRCDWRRRRGRRRARRARRRIGLGRFWRGRLRRRDRRSWSTERSSRRRRSSCWCRCNCMSRRRCGRSRARRARWRRRSRGWAG